MRERLRSIDKLLDVCQLAVTPQTFALMGLAAGALVLGLCLWHARRTGDVRDRLVHVLMLFSVWVVLFGPATEACTYAVIAPAIGWALLDAFAQPVSWSGRLVLIASLLLMGPVATDTFGSTVRLWANQYGSQPMGGLLFLLYLVVETVRGQKVPWAAGGRTAVPATVWAGSVVVFPNAPVRPAPQPLAGGASEPAWSTAELAAADDAPVPCP
jgi:hypothetical protein